MNRRDFLHPRRLAHTAGHVLGALDELQVSPETTVVEETLLLRLARRAMATTFEVVFPFGTSNALAMGEAALDRIDALEEQLTVYRDGSEVCRLNRTAPAGAVPVEERLFGLLEKAARITAGTGGAFDITTGTLIKAWGFFRGPRRVPADAERAEALAQVGMHWVELRPRERAVRYLRPRLEINLGAIGKGYALDRVAELLAAEWKNPSVLLHGGSSSVYARGCPPGNRRGWPVSLRHPWEPERRLAQVWLRDRGLGTSAATFQYLEYNGRKLGHVLDPRTGWPAAGVASASVLAPTAAEADALSTAFFVGGIELARRYCAAHPEVGAILLPEGDRAEPVVVGLAPHECEFLPIGERGRVSAPSL
jgi:thiamine biosynthesis lipoprotein